VYIFGLLVYPLLFGFKLLCLATTLVVRYFPSLTPFCPLGRLEVYHCFGSALPHAVWTLSGRPAGSMPIGRWRLGRTYCNFFLLFFLVILAPTSDPRYSYPVSTYTSDLNLSSSVFCSFSVGFGWGDEVRHRTRSNFSPPSLGPPSHLPYTPLLSLGYPPLPSPCSPPIMCIFSGWTWLSVTYPSTLLPHSPHPLIPYVCYDPG